MKQNCGGIVNNGQRYISLAPASATKKAAKPVK